MKIILLSAILFINCYAMKQDPTGVQLPNNINESFAITIQQTRAEFDNKKEFFEKKAHQHVKIRRWLFGIGGSLILGGSILAASTYNEVALGFGLGSVILGGLTTTAGMISHESQKMDRIKLDTEEREINAAERMYQQALTNYKIIQQ